MRILFLVGVVLLTGCSTGMLTGGDYYKEQPRTEGVASADTAVTDSVRRRMVDDSVLSHYTIGVTTYKGIVTPIDSSVRLFKKSSTIPM